MLRKSHIIIKCSNTTNNYTEIKDVSQNKGCIHKKMQSSDFNSLYNIKKELVLGMFQEESTQKYLSKRFKWIILALSHSYVNLIPGFNKPTRYSRSLL